MSISEGKKRLLLVDDDEHIARMERDMLTRLGYDAVVRTCSLEALDVFRETPHDFDLVLTDLDMPSMTGEVLARRLREIRPDTPIILCTGNATMTWEKAQESGFDTLLAKPFGFHDLALAIKQILT